MDNNSLNKYQEVIDKYAQDMASANPNPIPTPIISISPIQPPKMLSERTTVDQSTKKNVDTPLFVKILFYLSLGIFLSVFSAIIFNLYRSMTSPAKNDFNSSIAPVPTEATLGETCLLNDKNYQIGETFASADGCNTCSCGKDLTISCTDKACDTIPPEPTMKATTVTPTVVKISDTGPLKNILVEINKSLKTNYQEITLDNGKNWSVNLTKSYNKTNIKTITNKIEASGLQAGRADSVGEDWVKTYSQNSLFCELKYSQGVLTLTCNN